MLSDLRFAVRSLLKTPGFTLVAVLTMAIAIGASTALFSVLQAVVLRPLPYSDPDTMLYEVRPFDPGVFAEVMLGFAAVACVIPARKATKVDPMIALRTE